MSDGVTYELPISQPLTKAYINGDADVISQLFGYYAGHDEDWEARHKALNHLKPTRVDSKSLADVLREYNARMGASELTLHHIKQIADGAAVISGGQQAGLWTGPLLVIHKAVSIIQAAKSASAQLNAPVVPVFWIAGEDHDWDEVNHTFMVAGDQQLKKLVVQRDYQLRTSVSRTKIEKQQWDTLIAELSEVLSGSEYKDQLLLTLEQIVAESTSLSDCFARVMTLLFSDYGLVLIDSDDPQVRELEKEMFHTLLERNDELESAYLHSANLVQQLGYTLQADVTEGSANLFLFVKEANDDRVLLYKDGDRYRDRKGQYEWSKDELTELLQVSPQQFSNNVLTRPLMQDYLFPVLGTVLGPGEISYWALTKKAFEVLGMEMPIVVPRMSYTLVEGIVVKNMLKYDLSFADVMERFSQRKQAWLKEQDQYNIEERFTEVRNQFIDQYTPLIELATTIQAGLAKIGDTNMTKIMEQLSYMETKMIDAHHKQFDAAIRQLDRVELSIHPNGKPQERVLSMMSYWNRYDKEWLEQLMKAPYARVGYHEIVYL